MKKILIINGPNLNLLGKRETEIYGSLTLEEIKKYTEKRLQDKKLDIEWFQSNIEGEIIEKLHRFKAEDYEFLVINPAGYSHTSVAIYDAMLMCEKIIIEVHLSNVYSREDFRQTMLTARAASKIMSGLGKEAYYIAILSELNKG
jgi:3-dehydroquinate dehydratase-2